MFVINVIYMETYIYSKKKENKPLFLLEIYSSTEKKFPNNVEDFIVDKTACHQHVTNSIIIIIVSKFQVHKQSLPNQYPISKKYTMNGIFKV